MKNNNAVLTVDFRKEFSTGENSVQASSRVCISLDAIHSGLIKEIGANRMAILLAIVSYMDENGQCFPSQEKIAELTGQGRATVQRNLQELCEVEFNGQKLLHRELVGKTRKKTLYTISAGAITNTDLTAESKPQEKPEGMNSKDFVTYFHKNLTEVFSVTLSPNYSKEGAVIKRLLGTYDPETLQNIIDVVMSQYKNKWYKPQYPYPTIFQLGSWLANEAYKIVKAEQDYAEALENRQAVAVAQDDTDRALGLFDI